MRFITIFLFVFFSIFVRELWSFEAQAPYAVLLNYNNFEILYGTENMHKRVPPSSMTKIMTAYIIFDLLDEGKIKLTDTFKTSVRAWRQEGSRMFLAPDKKVKVHDLLLGLLAISGNDAAVVLAEGSLGTIDKFVERMNNKARELGLRNTHFANVNGLPDDDHYMSVYDTAVLSYHLIKNHGDYYNMFFNTQFLEYNKITQRNNNPLLKDYPGADGIKTGHTNSGGYALASSALRKGQRFIAVVNGLKSEREVGKESRKLLNYGYSLYGYVDLYKKDEIIDSLDILWGDVSFVNVYTKQDIVYPTKLDRLNKLVIEKIYKYKLDLPIVKDQVVGYIKITDGDKVTTYELYAKNGVSYVGPFKKIINIILLFLKDLVS